MPDRPVRRDPGRPSAGSRARAGGSARPVGDPPAGGTPPRTDGTPPRAGGTPTAAGAGPSAPDQPGARPPSFAPGSAGAPPRPAGDRAGPGSPAGPVRGSVPRASAQRPTAARPVPPRPPVHPGAPAGVPGAARQAWPAAQQPARPAGPPAGRQTAPPTGRPGGPPRTEPGAGRSAAPATRPSGHPPAPGGGAPPPRLGTATAVGPGRAGARRRRTALTAALLVGLLLAWPVGLLVWADSRLQHVDARAATPDTPGITYLLAGSDSRGGDGGIAEDGTEGARTDTIMLLHVPPSGPPALVSLPRDTLVDIPGRGSNKLNAAYSWGGAPLLVSAVEGLTGMHVDHYVEVGLGGVAGVVDALGGVNLCLDPAVNQVDFPVVDPGSGLVWETPGCRVVDGATSLAFARMRKADREGDIGRARRQQQLIAGLSSAAATPSVLLDPTRQVSLASAGIGALEVSEGTGVLDLARLGLAFRTATGPDGIRGTPPIASTDHRPGGVGSTVLLDPDTAPQFFADIMVGDLPPGPVGGVPAP